MKKCIITVVGKDTVGIIAKVTSYLAEVNINILDISQTVADVTNSVKEIGTVAEELEKLGLSIGVNIHCQRAEIFEKMHRL